MGSCWPDSGEIGARRWCSSSRTRSCAGIATGSAVDGADAQDGGASAAPRSGVRFARVFGRWRPPTRCGAHSEFTANCGHSRSTSRNVPCRARCNGVHDPPSQHVANVPHESPRLGRIDVGQYPTGKGDGKKPEARAQELPIARERSRQTAQWRFTRHPRGRPLGVRFVDSAPVWVFPTGSAATHIANMTCARALLQPRSPMLATMVAAKRLKQARLDSSRYPIGYDSPHSFPRRVAGWRRAGHA